MLIRRFTLICSCLIFSHSFGQDTNMIFSTNPIDSLTSYLLINKDLVDFYPSLFPFNSSFTISSDFGYREHPVNGNRRFHSGIDFRCPKGTDVISVANGRIIKIAINDPIVGNSITVSHLNGWETSYSHLEIINVKADELVNKYDVIGKTGDSGKVTGSHLHYTVAYKNKQMDPLPYCYLDNFIHRN